MKKITFDSIKQQATQDSDYCEGEINMMSYLPDYSAGRENPGRVQQFPELKRWGGSMRGPIQLKFTEQNTEGRKTVQTASSISL